MDPTILAAAWPLPEHPELAAALLTAYARDGYHDLRHLAEVLARLDELDAEGERFEQRPVRLAAWFHDAVYDGAPQPEERSAQWAARDLTAVGLDPAEVTEVARLVRLTERHDPAPADHNGAALCDADLAILAAPAGRYAEYAAGVRTDYAEVPDDLFRAGRIAVLRDLADRDHLFTTPTARTLWDPSARANLARELARLTHEDVG